VFIFFIRVTNGLYNIIPTECHDEPSKTRGCKKVRGEVRPKTGHGGPEEWRYCSTRSLTSAPDGSGWLTPRPSRFIPGKETRYPGWSPGSVWTGTENLAYTRIRSPDRLARSESLCRLRYHGPKTFGCSMILCAYLFSCMLLKECL
jgi:hypothetical protein